MLLGLTGAPGCGKSTALRLFSKLGWQTLDADALCHQLYAETESKFSSAVRERWGGRAFDANGLLDRKAIAGIVFNDETERLWLNNALHPEIRDRALDAFRKSGREAALFDVPLLFESGWLELFDKVIALWCEPEIQKARLLARGWDGQTIERRLKTQMTAGEKLEKADFALINNSSLEVLAAQCERLSLNLKRTFNLK